MPDETLHARIAADLRRRINDELAPGTPLPSEAALGSQYGVSRITARRAYQTLEQEGLVTAHIGRGRVVRKHRRMVYQPQREFEPRRSATMDRFMTTLTEEGRNPTQQIEVAVEPARGIVAERFGVPEDTPLAARKRVRYLDGEPFNASDTYYLHEVAKNTIVMNPADIPQGSNAVIRAIMGGETHVIDEYYVRMPTPAEAERLRLGQGTPVAIHYATGYTSDGRVIRVSYGLIPGDRHVIVYERTSPPDAQQ